MIKVAIMGFGTVGSGVAELLIKNKESISRKLGEDIEIKYILDLRDFPDSEFGGFIIHDFETLVNDPEVSIVVEAMGGIEPAFTFTKRLLLAGKHVTTSNKELVSNKGAELLEIAKEKNLNYMFEASVGGGIPIIRPLNQCLAANRVTKIVGILNGTTNYILTKMIREGVSFESALKEAQALGYAEANPSADVDGIDTQRKIAILSSLVYGREVDPRHIHTEGIRNIDLKDVMYASKLGMRLKLLAVCEQVERDGEEKLLIIVSPAMILKNHSLANVEDVFNGATIYGDAIGDVTFYGRGAGKMPTASAVVADMIDTVQHFKRRRDIFWMKSECGFVLGCEEFVSKNYVRAKVLNKDAALSLAQKLFGEISDVSYVCEDPGEIAFITGPLSQGSFGKSAALFKKEADIASLDAALKVYDI